jgi:hypothetical protein
MIIQAELIPFDAVATMIYSSQSSRSSYLIVPDEVEPNTFRLFSHEHFSLPSYPCTYLFGHESAKASLIEDTYEPPLVITAASDRNLIQ